MPDDGASHDIEKQSVEESPVQSFSPPPNKPGSQAAQTESDQEMKRDVKDIDDRVKRAERWMIGLTFAIALLDCAP